MRAIELVVLIAAVLSMSAETLAETHRCTNKSHFKTAHDGILRPVEHSIYIGRTFTVNVSTGEWRGAPANNSNSPNRKIEIVDPGNPGMSVSIVTTRGGAIGRLVDVLVIQTWVEAREVPFTYYDGLFGIFTGTCVRL